MENEYLKAGLILAALILYAAICLAGKALGSSLRLIKNVKEKH